LEAQKRITKVFGGIGIEFDGRFGDREPISEGFKKLMPTTINPKRR
jgi:hypothetical protein